MKRKLNIVKFKIIEGLLAIQTFFFCTVPVKCGIWESGDAADVATTDICALYVKWAIPVGVVVAILAFGTGNEKRKEIFKGVLICMVALYVVCLIISANPDYVNESLQHVADWFTK